MIKVQGNIFTVTMGVIAHGCNAQGKMASGIAGEIRKKYPIAYEKYMEAYEEYFAEYQDALPLGGVQLVPVNEFLIVANCITQHQYGKDGAKYVSYDAVDDCMKMLSEYSQKTNTVINFPLIGGGLGGGNRDVLISIFEQHFPGDNGVLWLQEDLEAVPIKRTRGKAVPAKGRKGK